MKKKSYLWNLLSVMMIVMLSLSYVSCGDDDEEDSGIAGTWVNDYKTMQLGRDGSYYSYYGSSPTGSASQYRKGSYSYNQSMKLMTVNIVAVPNHNNAYQNTYIVQTLTSTTLVLLYTDGDVEGYYTRK